MRKLKTEKLSVTIIPPATSYGPVDGRKYTLTENKEDGSHYLGIGYKYEMNLLAIRAEDTLTAQWQPHLGEYILTGKVYVSGNGYDEQTTKERFLKIQEKLPLAIAAVIEGDRALYSYVPWLVDAPIYIEFDSSFKQYCTIKYYGTPRRYLEQLN